MHVTVRNPDLVVAAGAQLGECPVWDKRLGVLFWLDIKGRVLHMHEPSGAADVAVDLGVSAGAIALSDGARLVTAVPDGFAWCDPVTGSLQRIAVVEHTALGTRFNDGACDPAGRFLAGTTTEAQIPAAAALYRLGPDSAVVGCAASLHCERSGLVAGRQAFLSRRHPDTNDLRFRLRPRRRPVG